MRKPEVTIPESDPPTDLVVEDLDEGDGNEATEGMNVTVHYVGVAWSTGEQFDASWDRMEPFRFGLGQGQVIQGWDQGVQGMKIGGRRRLTIPPEMGYGARGAGGVTVRTRRSSSSSTSSKPADPLRLAPARVLRSPHASMSVCFQPFQ